MTRHRKRCFTRRALSGISLIIHPVSSIPSLFSSHLTYLFRLWSIIFIPHITSNIPFLRTANQLNLNYSGQSAINLFPAPLAIMSLIKFPQQSRLSTQSSKYHRNQQRMFGWLYWSPLSSLAARQARNHTQPATRPMRVITTSAAATATFKPVEPHYFIILTYNSPYVLHHLPR